MRRPQFTLRSLLVAMLVVAAFFAGIRFERERRRREDEAAAADAAAAAAKAPPPTVIVDAVIHQIAEPDPELKARQWSEAYREFREFQKAPWRPIYEGASWR